VIALRIVTAAFAAFVALPLAWLVYAAFLTPEALARGNLATFGVTLENFAALAGSGLGRALGVSTAATGLVVASQLAVGLGAAYALRQGLRATGAVLVLLSLPSELLLVPIYRMLQQLGWLDTPGALVAPFLASPLVIFLLAQALRRFPMEVIEAARLDGAGEATIVARIVAPVLRPELLATGVLAFAAHWNLVLYPRIVVGSEWWTVQAFLTELQRTRPFDWGTLGAAALVASLPLAALYIAFEKRILDVFDLSFGRGSGAQRQ
jgi:multiple sugar transport system permease protein